MEGDLPSDRICALEELSTAVEGFQFLVKYQDDLQKEGKLTDILLKSFIEKRLLYSKRIVEIEKRLLDILEWEKELGEGKN